MDTDSLYSFLVQKKEANEEEDYYEKQMACIMLCWNADCIRYDWLRL